MTRSQTCAKCGQEVRHGKREDITGWLHRDPDIDHLPLFGGPLWTPELQADLEASLAEMAARGNARDKDDAPEPEWLGDEIPEPEIACHTIEVSDLRPRSGILGMANLILGRNKDKVQGWELRRLTHTRGPYVGARGQVLSIDDFIVLGAAGPENRVAVAAWRNYDYDFGYAGVIDAASKKIRTTPANSTELRSWIKGGLTPGTTEA